MKIDAKLIFGKKDESEEAQATYDMICNVNLLLGMQGLDYIESSFIDCGDTIEVNINRDFTMDDINKFKETMKSMEDIMQTFS